MFQSPISKFVKADVNGTINILRKVIGNSFIDNRNRLSAVQLVTVNPYKIRDITRYIKIIIYFYIFLILLML